MDVVATEVAAELKGLGNGKVREVLVAECHHLALCHEPRELVLAGSSQLAELDASDLGARRRGEVGDLHALWQ